MKLLKMTLTAGLLALSVSVLAHTGLKSSYPANEQMLDAAPEQLTFTFSGAVRLMKVTLMDSEDKKLALDFKPSANAEKTFEIEAPELTMGEYTVSWLSMGKDGHKIKGDFSFIVHGEGMVHDEKHKSDTHAH